MLAFAGVDTGVRDPEFVVPEMAVESTQIVESQAGTPQIIQKVDNSRITTNGGATMGKAPIVATSDPNSRLPTFLARFDLLEFNSLLASHFHRFGPSYGNFLHFSVPVEGLPLLEGLLKVYGDITIGFKEAVFLGNILMELLYAVLISLRDSSLDSLSEERLLELERSGAEPFGSKVQHVLLARIFAFTGPHAIPKAGFQEYRC